jgi:uncharacterized protein (DUF1697 family)
MTTQYLALLRGVNVGGNNLIKMTDLKACLEEAGFANVATYIQSGNVLFEAPKTALAQLEHKLERVLSENFDHYKAWVLVRSLKEMQQTVGAAPKGYGSEPEKYRYDLLFTRDPLTPAEVINSIIPKEGVDALAPGPEVVYWTRLTSRATSSRISRIASMPIYQNMTLRNWNTTTKLLGLMKARKETK